MELHFPNRSKSARPSAARPMHWAAPPMTQPWRSRCGRKCTWWTCRRRRRWRWCTTCITTPRCPSRWRCRPRHMTVMRGRGARREVKSGWIFGCCRCCRNGYLKITLATWSSHGNSAIHYTFLRKAQSTPWCREPSEVLRHVPVQVAIPFPTAVFFHGFHQMALGPCQAEGSPAEVCQLEEWLVRTQEGNGWSARAIAQRFGDYPEHSCDPLLTL